MIATIKKLTVLLLLATAMVLPVSADINQFRQTINENLKKVNPNYKVVSIEPSHLKGFYNVQLDNGPLIYVSENGQHFFDGQLYFLDNNRMVNISEQDSARARIALMDQFNPADMIIFSPKAPVRTKTHITVYTDVDCFYCQKLHQEVPELNARGIEVRYMAFPRAGIGSPSYKKIVSAWCAKDQQDAMTRLKNREQIPMADCDNPVQRHYELGKKMGVTGTPAIITESGGLIPGYRPAAEMAKALGI
ncbi:MAG TPA: thioredoxin fold domain-containing protein [Pseudomonadales bacterium]